MKPRNLILLLLPLMFLAFSSPATVHASPEPLRAACSVVVQGSSNQYCLTQRHTRKLLEWHGGAFVKSPVVRTPLKWTLYVYCAGKGNMVLTMYDLQMPLESEVVPCGQWKQEQ